MFALVLDVINFENPQQSSPFDAALTETFNRQNAVTILIPAMARLCTNSPIGTIINCHAENFETYTAYSYRV
ncbi:MAG: hypothetical protein C0507_24500 [Cyanobacteria bacterium PR.3.49]|nr:hypothetical protein [Cyanobacteria bacterium PR.3.49]